MHTFVGTIDSITNQTEKSNPRLFVYVNNGDFFPATVFIHETVQLPHLHEGDVIKIEGNLRSRGWTDSDGNKRYGLNIGPEQRGGCCKISKCVRGIDEISSADVPAVDTEEA